MNREELQTNFTKHGFDINIFSDYSLAVNYLREKIQGESVGFGGSITLKEIGLFDALAEKNTVVWHHHIAGNRTKELARQVRVYVTSVNAASETGELVNIDGAGNRISATLYGPEKVYYIIGKNKITPTLEKALYRAKNIAAPQNAQRLKVKTPCAKNGDHCYDCQSPERICRATVILDRAPLGLSSELIFIDDDLGL